jgi:hypothetical protein
MFRNIIRINKTYEYLPVREAKRLRVPDLPEWTGDEFPWIMKIFSNF